MTRPVVTADTITDEEIRELWSRGDNAITGRTLFIALGEAVGGFYTPSADEIREARARCAEIWNARKEGK